MPEIKAYIQKRLKELESERVATVQEILEYYTSVIRGNSKSSVLTLCGNGYQEVMKNLQMKKNGGKRQKHLHVDLDFLKTTLILHLMARL